MDPSRALDAPPALLSTVSVLAIGLALLLLASYLRRFESGPGRLLGWAALAVALAWYALFGVAFLYPHQHHRIWSAALSYRQNYGINAGLGSAWLIGSRALWRWLATRP